MAAAACPPPPTGDSPPAETSSLSDSPPASDSKPSPLGASRTEGKMQSVLSFSTLALPTDTNGQPQNPPEFSSEQPSQEGPGTSSEASKSPSEAPGKEDGLERSSSGRSLNAAAPAFVPRSLSQSLASPGAPSPTAAAPFTFAPTGIPGAPYIATPTLSGPSPGFVPGMPLGASQPLLPLPYMPGAPVPGVTPPPGHPVLLMAGRGVPAGYPQGVLVQGVRYPGPGMPPGPLPMPVPGGPYPMGMMPPMWPQGAGQATQGVPGVEQGAAGVPAPSGVWTGHGDAQQQGQKEEGGGEQRQRAGQAGQGQGQQGKGGKGQGGGTKKANQEAADAHFKGLSPEDLESLNANILRQIEFYFGDTNLVSDNHLQKLIKQDPEGFVALRVILDFKKVKSLVPAFCAGTPAFVALAASALKSSSTVVVNEGGLKVKRVTPLPDIDPDDLQRRTVIAENLPQDHSVAAMEAFFGKAGKVKMVRVCQPQAANGANNAQAKKGQNRYMVTNKLHALIEYETVEDAENAANTLNDSNNWRSGLHVKVMLPRVKKHAHAHAHGHGHGRSHSPQPQGQQHHHNNHNNHNSHNNHSQQGHHGHQHGQQQQSLLKIPANCRHSPPPPGMATGGTPGTPPTPEGDALPQPRDASATSAGSNADGGSSEGENAVQGAEEATTPGAQQVPGKKRQNRNKKNKNKGAEGSSKSPARSPPVHNHAYLHSHGGSSKSRENSPLRHGGRHSGAHSHSPLQPHGHSHSPVHGSPLRGAGDHAVRPPPGPRMPDGTRGFAVGRGKAMAPPAPAAAAAAGVP